MDQIIRQLPVSQIERDPNQPRREVGDLAGLKCSIQETGLVQAIIVTPIGPDRYGLVVGERRYRAAVELGRSTIAAIVRDVAEHERRYLQLVENLQRKDLNPFELGDSFRRLIDEHDLTEAELGAKLGKSQDYVSNMLTIAKEIPDPIRREFYATSRKIRASILLEIARAEGLPAKLRMWEQARDGRYTVKQARAERAGEGKKGGEARAPSPRAATIQLDKWTVTVRGEATPTLGEVLEALGEAVQRCEQRIADYRYLAERRGAR